MDLSGCSALVTGAGGYLGSAISTTLASAGATVHLVGRNSDSLQVVFESIELSGGQARVWVCDIANPEDREELVRSFQEHVKDLDVVVHNAHSSLGERPSGTARDPFDAAFSVSVVPAAYINDNLTPLLRSAFQTRGSASIIHVASMYGVVSPDPRIYLESGMNSPPWYGAAKAALIQYTRYASVHLGHLGIRVNAVSPGPFPSQAVQEDLPHFVELLASRTALGRIGRPHEVAKAVLFLASDASSFVTGVNLLVDGGWTAS